MKIQYARIAMGNAYLGLTDPRIHTLFVFGD